MVSIYFYLYQQAALSVNIIRYQKRGLIYNFRNGQKNMGMTCAQQRRVEELREKYADDRDALATLDETSREHDLFRAYHDAYGYVFYVMRKPTA